MNTFKFSYKVGMDAYPAINGQGELTMVNFDTVLRRLSM